MDKQQELWPTDIYAEVLRKRALPVARAMFGGESLSSWIVRIADVHGMSTQQLGAWLMGRGRQVFTEDVDRGAWSALVEEMSRATGQATDALMQGTLRAYERVLWGEMPRQGATRWVLPVMKNGTQRIGYGVQYCAYCLATDEIPYLRLVWRLAFVVACPGHACLLQDRCNHCQAPVAAHRWRTGVLREVGSSGIVWCHECGADRRKLAIQRPVTAELIAAQERMLAALQEGAIMVEGQLVHCLPFFTGAAMIWSLLDDPRDADAIWNELELEVPIFVRMTGARYGGFERRTIDQRAVLLDGFDRLLRRGVEKFIRGLSLRGLSSHTLLRYSNPRKVSAPFWYWSLVRKHLDRTFYIPSNEELDAAIRHLSGIDGRAFVRVSDVCQLLGMATSSNIRVGRRMRALGVLPKQDSKHDSPLEDQSRRRLGSISSRRSSLRIRASPT